MQQRFVSIWFRSLKTDWLIRRHPELKDIPFVLCAPDHGKMIVTTSTVSAQHEGIFPRMSLADARAMIPGLQHFDDEPGHCEQLLKNLALWFIRYTPFVAIDAPEGLMLEATGCAHLWGGEEKYLTDIQQRLYKFGYDNNLAIADTIGTAWAVAHFAKEKNIVEPDQQKTALLSLPSAALRIEPGITERLDKLGLRTINHFINMPRPALRRRFGLELLTRLDQALGYEMETIEPVIPIEPYQERLPCIEPIVTATGIEIALERLLQTLCQRLLQEQKGLRTALFKGYRVDGKIVQIDIGTNRPSCNVKHLFKLFEIKINTIEPALGIELFTLEANKVEDLPTVQEILFQQSAGLDDNALAELLDRIAGKLGAHRIQRYLPAEHYWPERSFKSTPDINEKPQTVWKLDRPRPIQLLQKPELIEVTAPVPDYPPMNFRYKGELHTIVKADGPERIEQEWWLQEGRHRDYYCVQDEDGNRYWLFRSGHYNVEKTIKWYLHGYFA